METFENQTFEKINYTLNPLPKGEYDTCVFKLCELQHGDLSDIQFIDCTFIDSNLSVAKLRGTSFRNVQFNNCKMLGLLFYECNEFGMSVGFDNCQLNHASFYQRKIPKTIFKNTKLEEVDFSECDLSGAVFQHCDLKNAQFSRTNLEKADLRTVQHVSLDPEINKIKKAKFSLHNIAGLLDKYNIEID